MIEWYLFKLVLVPNQRKEILHLYTPCSPTLGSVATFWKGHRFPLGKRLRRLASTSTVPLGRASASL